MALALHHSGARELLSTVQRRAMGGRRVLILSYHRVVGDYAAEEHPLNTLNIERETFRRHLEDLHETHDIVSLEDALRCWTVRTANRDVAVITFDDGYRDVYTHAFPVMRELARSGGGLRAFGVHGHEPAPGSRPHLRGAAQHGRPRALGHLGGCRREGPALPARRARRRRQRLRRARTAHRALPTPDLLELATELESRLGLTYADASEGQLP